MCWLHYSNYMHDYLVEYSLFTIAITVEINIGISYGFIIIQYIQ